MFGHADFNFVAGVGSTSPPERHLTATVIHYDQPYFARVVDMQQRLERDMNGLRQSQFPPDTSSDIRHQRDLSPMLFFSARQIPQQHADNDEIRCPYYEPIEFDGLHRSKQSGGR